MIHNLSTLPDFRDEVPNSPISELALRVVVEFEGWRFLVVGTASIICGHLAITARHVFDYIVQTFGAKSKDGYWEVDGYEIKLIQVLPGPGYRIWRVVTAWPCTTDIAVLHLGLDRTSSPGEVVVWKQPHLRALPPAVGQKVVAFGYRESEITVNKGADGTHHIELNDRPTTSIGIIREVYPQGRDSIMLPFPCFEIEARFEPGMSGGMVIDEMGKLCGLICSSFKQNDSLAPPISYVAALWPMFQTVISADRGDKYPRDSSYPMIDLVANGLVAVADTQELYQLLTVTNAASGSSKR